VLAVGLLAPASGFADEFIVQNTNDSGPGSLRQAILDSNTSANPPDTIRFTSAVRGTIPLTSGQLEIEGALHIQGPGANDLAVVNAAPVPGPDTRIFFVHRGATAAISALTMRGGDVEGGEDGNANGGGIFNQGSLTLKNSVVDSNLARAADGTPGGRARGGGIINLGGAVRLIRTTVSNNEARSGATQDSRGAYGSGGGIHNQGTLEIADSTIAGNQVRGGASFDLGGDALGGGISMRQGSATIRGSTISGNTTIPGAGEESSYSEGAGIDAGAPVDITNSTISDNVAQPGSTSGPSAYRAIGGGIHVDDNVSLMDVTVAYNSARIGANLYSDAGIASLKGTIVSNPQGGGDDCWDRYPGTKSLGYNLEYHTSCHLFANGDQSGSDPHLGPLQDNGGPTKTRAIPIYSEALDWGISVSATDQRGEKRPVLFPGPRHLPSGGDGSDVGAFELQAGLGGQNRRIRGSVDPDRAPKGEKTCFHFKAKRPDGEPLRNVDVHLGGKEQDTGHRGRATICKKFNSDGVRHARLEKRAWETDRLRIRIFD
jgi:hypothetical protein